MNEYDTANMSETQKKKVQEEAQQFSSSLFNYGVKVPNVRFNTEEQAVMDIVSSYPLYGTLAKMGMDIVGAEIEREKVSKEKYQATREMQEEIRNEQAVIAMAHIINLVSKSTVIPKDVIKLIDSEIKQDQIDKRKKQKMIE